MQEEFLKMIKEKMKQEERGITWLANKVGTSKENLSGMLKRMERGENVTLDKVAKICEVLKIKMVLK